MSRSSSIFSRSCRFTKSCDCLCLPTKRRGYYTQASGTLHAASTAYFTLIMELLDRLTATCVACSCWQRVICWKACRSQQVCPLQLTRHIQTTM